MNLEPTEGKAVDREGAAAGRGKSCPYLDRGACDALLAYLGEASFSLLQQVKRRYCRGAFRMCARHNAFEEGAGPEELGRLAPWAQEQPGPAGNGQASSAAQTGNE